MVEMRNLRGMFRVAPAVLGIVCLALAPLPAATEGIATSPSDPNVFVRRIRTPDYTDLVVENHKSCRITLMLTITVNNATVLRVQDETAVYPAHSRTVAARLSPLDPTRPRNFVYHFRWIKGDMNAQHDDRAVYVLPFESETSHWVAQGYEGRWSHKGADRYAVDFAMPEGTIVCAARDGVVVDLRQSSEDGGVDEKDSRRANYVSILHEDGTIAEYLHLQHGGVLVRLNQRVTAGMPIARSGNTGYSSQPHLHFGVYAAVDATRSQSSPVTFMTRQGTISKLIPGRIYTAK